MPAIVTHFRRIDSVPAWWSLKLLLFRYFCLLAICGILVPISSISNLEREDLHSELLRVALCSDKSWFPKQTLLWVIWYELHKVKIILKSYFLFLFLFFWYIYWLCYYSCPISAPSLNSILPTSSLPHSPPIVHVHGSYL